MSPTSTIFINKNISLEKENISLPFCSHLFTRRLSALVRADRIYPGKLNLMENGEINQDNLEKGRKRIFAWNHVIVRSNENDILNILF